MYTVFCEILSLPLIISFIFVSTSRQRITRMQEVQSFDLSAELIAEGGEGRGRLEVMSTFV